MADAPEAEQHHDAANVDVAADATASAPNPGSADADATASAPNPVSADEQC